MVRVRVEQCPAGRGRPTARRGAAGVRPSERSGGLSIVTVGTTVRAKPAIKQLERLTCKNRRLTRSRDRLVAWIGIDGAPRRQRRNDRDFPMTARSKCRQKARLHPPFVHFRPSRLESCLVASISTGARRWRCGDIKSSSEPSSWQLGWHPSDSAALMQSRRRCLLGESRY